jgi:hypothetical protein
MARSIRVLLAGAYERDNFGDLLFLLVTERYLDGAEVVAAAPFSADMRALVDRHVPAYGPLLRDEAFDAIWTVGGQVGRIVAAAYGVPRVSLSKPKPTRYARLWDSEMPFDVGLGELDEAIGAAIARAATPAAAAHADRLSRMAHDNLEHLADVVLSGKAFSIRTVVVVTVAGFHHARSVRRNGAPVVLTAASGRLTARTDRSSMLARYWAAGIGYATGLRLPSRSIARTPT